MTSLLFDFDGVIADTFELSLSTARKRLGHDLEADYYRDFFNGNIYKHDKVGEKNWENWEEDPFFKIQIPQLNDQPIFDGMTKIIETLSKNHVLHIVSSSPSKPIQDYLKLNQVDSYFDQILGADVDTDKFRKIQSIIDGNGHHPHQMLFVTDTVGDVKEALNCDVRSKAETWGFHQKHRLDDVGAHAVVESPRELENEIQQYFSQL